MGSSQSKLSPEQLADLKKITYCKLPQWTLSVPLVPSVYHITVDRNELQQWLADSSRSTPLISQKTRCSYRTFLKDCPEGKLDKAGFTQIYQQVFPYGDPDEFANYTFKVFDEDKNDTIDFREFALALSLTSRGTAEEKLLCAPRPTSRGLSN